MWPSHDGLELMRYRSACRLHLTLKVYNFCNMSKVNEREKTIPTAASGGGRGRGTNGDNCIENLSIHFHSSSPLSLHPHHQHVRYGYIVSVRFLVMLLVLARNGSSSFHAVIAPLVAINKNSLNDNNSIRGNVMAMWSCFMQFSYMHAFAST